MRIRTIVAAAFFAALVFDGAWMWSALAAAPKGAASAILLRHVPALVLAGLALYALVALLLVTALTVVDTARVRSRLADFAAPNLRDWAAAFAATGLRRLATRLLDLAPVDMERRRPRIVLQSRFDPAHARREISQLYSTALVRAQFVTALTLILVLAIAAFVHDGMQRVIVPAGILAVPALAAAAMLAVLGILGWIVVATAAEPLIETIANLPCERLDIELLRRSGGLAEAEDAARTAASGAALSAAIGKLLERLVSALDESRSTLIEAIGGLSARAEALSAALQSAVERGTEPSEGGADLAELRATLTQLTAVLDRLTATGVLVPAGRAGETVARKGEAAMIEASRSEISREVRGLLADLE